MWHTKLVRTAILAGSITAHALLSSGCYVILGEAHTSPNSSGGVLVEGSDLKLHMGGFIYECQSFRLFGKRSVKGVCIDGITVRLPPMSKTVVYVTANQSNGKFITVAETLQILEAMSFDDARVEVAELLSR